MSKRDELIAELLASPEKLLQQRPFFRGFDRSFKPGYEGEFVENSKTVRATLPRFKGKRVSQEMFMRELDPYCHDVVDDENIPAICVKVAEGDYKPIKEKRTPIPLQRLIKDEQVVYLTKNDMRFTQVDTNPTQAQNNDFITFKQFWKLRNQDGMKNKMVDTQLSYGNAGLLYYFDYKGRIKSRLISFKDEYIICSHNDQNGDRILEVLYYTKDGVEYIDAYDDTFKYRWTNDGVLNGDNDDGWRWHEPEEHGFEEIPLITKHGNVAWNDAQDLIDVFETMFNVFDVIQKRHGWGILWIKGKFKDKVQKIAGNVILNDTNAESGSEAKFLTPPNPEGMFETLKNLLRAIQIASSTTFILPDDIRLSGDVSGLAVQLTKELDLLNAEQKVIDWQNVADKMVRLFKFGLAKELVNKGIKADAVTEFENLHINAEFEVWRPFNNTEYNIMLSNMKQSGIISQETAIEVNTVSKPDEKARVQREIEEQRKYEEQQAERKQQEQQNTNNSAKEGANE